VADINWVFSTTRISGEHPSIGQRKRGSGSLRINFAQIRVVD
jgi:hypothetical protein